MGSLHFAAALRQGARIGLGQRFVGEDMFGVGCGTAGTCISSGLWKNVTNRYLGFKFKIHGKAHYGWARLTVRVPSQFVINATLTGYAYETVPGKSIQAGQTTDAGADATDGSAMSLGRLALGSQAVAEGR